jgi:Sulfotransferase family
MTHTGIAKHSIHPKPSIAPLPTSSADISELKLSIVPEPSIVEPLNAPDSGHRTLTHRTVALKIYSANGWAPVGAPARRPVAPGERVGQIGYTVRLEQIGYHMYYGGGGAYLYQPIPKNACTTIKTLLLQMEGLPVDDNVWRRHQKEYNRFPGTNHLTIQEQLDIFEGRTHTFKFVIVRNPYARLASAYCDKILSNPTAYLIRKITKSAADQGTVLSDPITFEQFVTVVSCQSLGEMDPHCRPQYYEGRFAMVKYDFIGRMEAMPRDLVYALERIGAPDSIIARVNERHNVAGSSIKLWEAVSPEAHRLFLATFGIDFDVLQYRRRLLSGA